MYAVIKTGGKQYKVAAGQKLKVEKIDAEVGDTVEFDTVLLVSKDDKLTIGSPVVEGAKVTAQVVAQKRAKKIEIIKFKRRKHSMKRQGHRQYFTEVEINAIAG